MEGCHHTRSADADPPPDVQGSALKGEGQFLEQEWSDSNNISLPGLDRRVDQE